MYILQLHYNGANHNRQLCGACGFFPSWYVSTLSPNPSSVFLKATRTLEDMKSRYMWKLVFDISRSFQSKFQSSNELFQTVVASLCILKARAVTQSLALLGKFSVTFVVVHVIFVFTWKSLGHLMSGGFDLCSLFMTSGLNHDTICGVHVKLYVFIIIFMLNALKF